MAAHDAGVFDFDTVESLLCTARFEESQPIWNSSNYVFICQMESGDRQFAAIYKPRGGESPLWDFPAGTLYQREIAAYRLARLLDWPMVPPTVLREGPRGVGALQLFVAHDPRQHFFTQREDEELLPQLKRMAVFDILANNADRKGGHCLLDEERTIWGIDHGICFHEDFKLRTVMWDWADEPIPSEWLDDVARLRDCLATRDTRVEPLLELLSTREQRALAERAESVLQSRRFPRPGPYRPYPWPLI